MIYNSSNLSFIGGRFSVNSSNAISNFLALWPFADDDIKMPYAVWHSIGQSDHDGIQIGHFSKDLGQNSDRLMRLQIFGEGGDFSLRRDEDQVYWHFVGNRIKLNLPNDLKISDFGDKNQGLTLTSQSLDGSDEEELISGLLWGDYGQNSDYPDHWHDDRVGWATERLNYPDMATEMKGLEPRRRRVMVMARVLRSTNYSIAAYWTLRLDVYNQGGA